jgi:hypothetical protein
MQLMDATSRNKYCNHDLFNQVMMAVSGAGGGILEMLRSRIKNEILQKGFPFDCATLQLKNSKSRHGCCIDNLFGTN